MLVAVLAGLLLFVPHEARSQENGPPGDAGEQETSNGPESRQVHPWTKGVSAEAEEAANHLVAEGTELYALKRYTEALDKYEAALAYWDHPAVRYNTFKCLLALEEPVKAYENLVASLRYGPEPFDSQEIYETALREKNLLEGQLATIVVSTETAGAEVSLDGEALLIGPGKSSKIVRVGEHQVAARKRGYLTQIRAVVANPRATETLDFALCAIADQTVRLRRWKPWKPWLVVGAGLVVAAGGVPVYLKAVSDQDSFDAAATERCPDGCPPGDMGNMANLDAKARRENQIAVAMFAVGGAALTAGLVLAYLNRKRTVLRPGVDPGSTAETRLILAPVSSGDRHGFLLGFAF